MQVAAPRSDPASQGHPDRSAAHVPVMSKQEDERELPQAALLPERKAEQEQRDERSERPGREGNLELPLHDPEAGRQRRERDEVPGQEGVGEVEPGEREGEQEPRSAGGRSRRHANADRRAAHPGSAARVS